MKPLAQLPEAAVRGLRGVLTDIDDTLSTDGRITAAAYGALEALRASGLRVIPITGRPAGWCDHIARMWPVDAVVGENGAFYMRYDAAARKLAVRSVAAPADRARLLAIGERVIAAVPGCAWASDQSYRLADIAIDFCEDVSPLPAPAVDHIVALLEGEGLRVKVSSIHVNAWFGGYDKLSTTRLLLHELYQEGLEQERESYVFVGDSPNDAPMFAYFPYSVGVANVKRWLSRLSSPPAFVTTGCCGAGFVELANAIMEKRKSA
jgi:hypothetical protein